MYTYIKKHLFLFSTILFLSSLGLTGAIYLTSPESALPVQLTLVGDGQVSMADVAVSRLSVNGAAKPLVNASRNTMQATFSDVAQHVYYGGLRVSFSARQLASFRTVAISIGSSTVRYEKKRMLEKWSRYPGSDSLSTFDYTGSTADERIFGKPTPILNADVSGHSFFVILANRLPFLLLLLFIGLASANKLTEQYIGRWSQRPALLSALFTLVLLLYKLPYSIQPVGFGLDPSWITALNWAQYKGLNWGEDLAFTYGPYFWLLYPGIVASQGSLITAFVVTVVVYGYSIGTITHYLVQGFRRNELSLTMLGISLIVLLFFDFTITDIVILVPVLVLSEDKYQYGKSLPGYVLMAILSLCKFSYLPVSICIVVFVSLKLLFQREWLSSLLNVGTFVVSIVVLWYISGQPIENLALFVKQGYQIAGGYSEAMGTAFWNNDQSLLGNLLVNVALLFWGGLFVVGVLVLFGKACFDGKDWFKLFLTAPILFLAFKEGYVRMDFAHSKLFFSQLVLVLITYVLLLKKNRHLFDDINSLLVLLILGSLLFVDASHPASYVASISTSFNSAMKEKTMLASQKNAVSHYQLTPNLVKGVGNSRVDIFPYDVSLLYAYNFKWTPRPVFQSYSAYTHRLDSLNAQHVCDSKAPEKLLFSFASIDNRYPLFDEPMVVRAIRSNYQAISSNRNRFLLLQRLKKSKKNSLVSTQKTIGRLNETIHIPVLANCDTYMYTDLRLTLLGKFCNFLLKVQPPYIEIKTEKVTQPKRYRLIRQTANDGLLVSSIAEDSRSALPLLTGQSYNNGRSITIIGNPLLYEDDMAITFVITQTDVAKN